MHGGDEKCIQTFGLRYSREKLLSKPRYRWEYNIKIILYE